MNCTRMCFAVLLVSSAQVFSAAKALAAPKYTCTKPVFAKPTEIGKDDVYKATTYADCTLLDTPVGGADGLQNLWDEMVRDAGRATIIHEGPVSDRLEGLPAVRFDLTEGPTRNGYSVTIRKVDRFATDSLDVLKYVSESVSVQGTGTTSKYLRKVDIRFDIAVAKAPHSYTGRISTTIHVDRPSFIPSGIFKSQADKNVLGEFKKNLDQIIPRIIDKM